uniref:Uncharacterized protein MANES_03G206500 n=1 Tax=Rhizophora mucronata TaxID=61149 RepID=A0A2P2LRL4_RHIMU
MKKTLAHAGCCFIKYATSGEADRAIKALHNQHTLPGGVGPIQVRYADGERERLGAVEYKLFVGSLNKQATEKEVEEIFARHGHVEDVYLMRDNMKQSRGCGFVKYLHRDMALAAINALNGIYTMRGCDQPLTVRFADPKRPRPGESRGGPVSGAPGFGPRFQAPGPRPPPSFGGSIHDQIPPTAWDLMNSQNLGPPGTDVSSFGRSSDLGRPLNQGGPLGGPSDGALPALMDSTAKQSFSQPVNQAPPVSQQISPLQKPLLPPQHLPPSLQLYPQLASFSQAQTSYVNQPQHPLAAGQIPFTQPLTSQHSLGLGGPLSTSQPPLQQGLSATTALQAPLNINLQSQSQFHSSSVTNTQQLPAPVQHPLLQLRQQSPQLAQMLSQQTQTLQASFQSSQQAFSQLQQQVQMMQPAHQGLSLQQSSQVAKQQWPGMAPQNVATTAASTLPIDVSHASAPTAAVVTQTVPVKYNWTEHTSPEGFKYYYNSVTRESQWEKPEELALVNQQHSQPQQQQLQLKHSVQQPQNQAYPHVLPTQKVPQAQPVQFQAQNHQQQPSVSSLVSMSCFLKQ